MPDLEQILAALSLEEKVLLTAGESIWRTHAIESKGIPLLKVSDGPNGVRGDGGASAVSFPVGVCMASSWNTDLIRTLGRAIAEEAKTKSVDVVLGPTINIQRTPLGGRNFECYSEDPWLSATLATAFTRGVQSQQVGACLKHYVCNDSEFERHTISVEVDERTLREVYLRPFELAVRDSRPWTIMASYNRIHGVWACSHDELVNQVLKGEWGFDGLVISDWFAAKETVPNALGGLDLEMPGPAASFGDKLLAAVISGEVPVAVVDDKVRRLLRVLDWTGKFSDPADRPEQALDRPEHRAIARQAATEGMVLLKNNGVLPLAPENLQTLAVIGPNAREFRIMGGGSSSLRPHHVSSPLDALTDQLGQTRIEVVEGCTTHKYLPAPDPNRLSPERGSNTPGLRCEFYATPDTKTTPLMERVIARGTIMLGGMAGGSRPKSAILRGFFTPEVSGKYEFGLFSTGAATLSLGGELLIDNASDTTPGDAFFGQATSEKRAAVTLEAHQPVEMTIAFTATNEANNFRAFRYGILPPQPEDAIADAAALAATADAVLLMLGTNDDWETEGNDREMLSLPGEQDQLVAAVCAANPNTIVVNNSGSPVAMPWVDSVAAIIQTWFPGQEYGHALADLLLGHANPSGKLPITFPKRLEDTPAFTSYPGEFGKVYYGEGLFVGHRWYDARDIEPLFCFGHGLSYTHFTYERIERDTFDGESFSMAVVVTNTGDRAGMETVQIYVQPVAPGVARPLRELRTFAKVELAPGETRSIPITLAREAFAYWNPVEHNWVVEAGQYLVHAASSSRDIRLTREVTIS
ncbi:MAG: glycoside hydrolase family 3 C-terminal domain-containing protein [Pseudomonadota bacterium]